MTQSRAPRPRAWLFNLDADLELARPEGYGPTGALRTQMAQREGPLASLMAPGDVVVREGDRLPAELRGIEGRAFCMTPRARRLLRDAGAAPAPAPIVEVLRRANGRAFAADLGQTLEQATFARTLAEVERAVARPAGPRGWLLKRAFSMAGKGQRRVRGPGLEAADRAWVEASLAAGDPHAGIQVEPRVEVLLEVGVHGWLGSDGGLLLGVPRVQRCDGRGAWQGSRAPADGELEPEEIRALNREVVRVVAALRKAGYFGPFGVDAYRYRDRSGRAGFNPRSEVNARYSMGWASGMVAAGHALP